MFVNLQLSGASSVELTQCCEFVLFRLQVQQHGGQLSSRDASGLPHAPVLSSSTAAGQLLLHKYSNGNVPLPCRLKMACIQFGYSVSR